MMKQTCYVEPMWQGILLTRWEKKRKMRFANSQPVFLYDIPRYRHQLITIRIRGEKNPNSAIALHLFKKIPEFLCSIQPPIFCPHFARFSFVWCLSLTKHDLCTVSSIHTISRRSGSARERANTRDSDDSPDHRSHPGPSSCSPSRCLLRIYKFIYRSMSGYRNLYYRSRRPKA